MKQNEWIRINQLGYRNDDIKIAVFLSVNSSDLKSFKVVDAKSGKVVMTFDKVIKTGSLDPFKSCYRLPFTNLKQSGVYRIVAGNAESPEFPIGE